MQMEERHSLSWDGFLAKPSIMVSFIFLEAFLEQIRGAAS
jgi:hypothetical protein